MTTKKAKQIGTWLLCAFCIGVGCITGWMAASFSWTSVLIGFFSLIGFVVFAVLTYAAIFDDTPEQEEEIHSYPTPQGFDKSYEN